MYACSYACVCADACMCRWRRGGTDASAYMPYDVPYDVPYNMPYAMPSGLARERVCCRGARRTHSCMQHAYMDVHAYCTHTHACIHPCCIHTPMHACRGDCTIHAFCLHTIHMMYPCLYPSCIYHAILPSCNLRSSPIVVVSDRPRIRDSAHQWSAVSGKKRQFYYDYSNTVYRL
jgi:hypothetical protein